MHVHIHIHPRMEQQLVKKEAMNLKRLRRGYMGGFEERNGKAEMM